VAVVSQTDYWLIDVRSVWTTLQASCPTGQMTIVRVWMECAIMICANIQRHLDSLKWKIEFSDTNFSSENLANISTECFRHHQGKSKDSVKTTSYSHALLRIRHWMAMEVKSQ